MIANRAGPFGGVIAFQMAGGAVGNTTTAAGAAGAATGTASAKGVKAGKGATAKRFVA